MIKIVVPISGGKDSQACLKLALETYAPAEILGFFCDTRFEHPLTYTHIETIGKLYGVEIRTVCAGSVEDQILKNGMFPNSVSRFCTDRLKIQPSKRFYKDLAEEQGEGFEVWLGMRAGESNKRARRYKDIIHTDRYAPHDVLSSYPKYLEKLGVSFRLPILEWSFDDVMDYLEGDENPLYKKGFDRVGCFPCLATSDTKKERAFKFDEFGAKQRETVMRLDKIIGVKNTNQYDLFRCSFCEI